MTDQSSRVATVVVVGTWGTGKHDRQPGLDAGLEELGGAERQHVEADGSAPNGGA